MEDFFNGEVENYSSRIRTMYRIFLVETRSISKCLPSLMAREREILDVPTTRIFA